MIADAVAFCSPRTALAGGQDVWQARRRTPERALVCLLSALIGTAIAQPLPLVSEPDEAAQWNAAWEDFAAQPIRLGTGHAADVTELPGVDDSLARRIASPRASVPEFLQPYVRRSGQPRLRWRTRLALADPADPNRWRRAATHGRLLASVGGWDGGVVIERDSGEPGIADYLSGTLGYRSSDGGTSLVLGHLRAQVGIGLLTSRTSAFWLDFASIRPRATSLSGALAATESGELFGAGAMRRRGAWEGLFLITRPRWDATTNADGVVTNVRTDGIHVTDAERRAEKRLTEVYALAHLGWQPAAWFSIGLNGARSQFSLPTRLTLTASEPVRDQTLAGFDVRLDRKSLDLWGEAVRDFRGAAGLTGAAIYKTPPASLVVAGWLYDRDLVLPHGGGWSFRDEPTDERAALASVRWRQGRLRTDVVGAWYSQEHASRVDSLPRTGTWEEVRAEYRVAAPFTLRGRYKRRTTARPGQGTGTERRRDEVRGEVLWAGGTWSVGSRADWVRARPDGIGVLAALSGAHRRSELLAVNVQVAAFRSTASQAALYLYDPRAPGFGVVRTLTGTGVAWFSRLGGTVARLDWSCAMSGITRRSSGTKVTLTVQLEYHFR